MAIYKVPDDILIEYKKLLLDNIREYQTADDILDLPPKIKKIVNKLKKQLKILEDNYGI